jgi:radical SAM superfamily enzyme YgiQ (UPF0313 family)
MEKDLRVEQILQARQSLKEHSIRACFFLQFGYAGETWQDIRETINLVRQARPDDIGVSVSYPLPGTKFHSMVSDQLDDKTNWEDSEDLAMMFKGAYTNEFYHALHDALHLEVDLMRSAGEAYRDLRGCSELADLWLRVGELETRCRNAVPTALAQPARTSLSPKGIHSSTQGCGETASRAAL